MHGGLIIIVLNDFVCTPCSESVMHSSSVELLISVGVQYELDEDEALKSILQKLSAYFCAM